MNDPAAESFPKMSLPGLPGHVQIQDDLNIEDALRTLLTFSDTLKTMKRLSTPYANVEQANSAMPLNSPGSPKSATVTPPKELDHEIPLHHSGTNSNILTQYVPEPAHPEPHLAYSDSPPAPVPNRQRSRSNTVRQKYVPEVVETESCDEPSITMADVKKLIQTELKNVKPTNGVRTMRTNRGTTLLVENDTASVSFKDCNKNIVSLRVSYEEGLTVGNKYKLHNNSGILCQLVTPQSQHAEDDASYVGRFVEVTGKALKLGELIVPEVQLSRGLNNRVYGVIRGVPKDEFVKSNVVHSLNPKYSFVTVAYKGLMETDLHIESDGPTTNFIPVGTIFVAGDDGKPKMLNIDHPDDLESYKSNHSSSSTDSSSDHSAIGELFEPDQPEQPRRDSNISDVEPIKKTESKSFHPMINDTLSYCQSFAIPFMKVISHVGNSSFVVNIC